MVSGSRTARSKRSRWALVVLPVAALAVVGIAHLQARRTVRWSEVAQAIGRQDTLHGTGRVYLADGSEWEYALWGKIEGPGKTITNGVAMPVRLPPGQNHVPAQPDSTLTGLGGAMDVCGQEGVVTKLAAAGQRARGKRADWGGKRALVVEVDTPPGLRDPGGRGPDSWRFYIDPESKLVLAVNMFVRERNQEVLRARCEYEYNAPLPEGFKEK